MTASFRVQGRMCATCIYRADSPLDLEKLEREIADGHGGFNSFRVCHHSADVCCRGFWERHKDRFQVGQVAQRLGVVEFVEVDTLREVKVGDVYEVEGLEWTVHRIANYRVAACNRLDEHGLRHYRTFALEKLRAGTFRRSRD